LKVLLVTPFYTNGVVGPAKFSVILKSALPEQVDILTENSNDPDVISVTIKLNYFERKLTQYFNRFIYHKKIHQLLRSNHEYTHLIFINGILGYGFDSKEYPKLTVIHMINHEQYAILKPYPGLKYLAQLYYVWMEKHTIRNAQHLIVNSDYLKNKIIRDFGIDPSRIFILRKSIVTVRYSFKPERDIDLRSVKILFVKTDWKIGGLEDIAGALKLLPEIKFTISIVGPGKEHEKKIKQLFVKLTNVKLSYLGKQSEGEVIQLLAEHDILCIPSRSEALGVAIMEGLASGIPVVTTNVGGIGEVTKNGEYAWVAQPENPESLAETIQDCLGNREKRIIKSSNGRNYIENYFDSSRMLKDFLSIMNSV
jgi:colanic acid/amylovoran biosynthesis glycosyltransferase